MSDIDHNIDTTTMLFLDKSDNYLRASLPKNSPRVSGVRVGYGDGGGGGARGPDKGEGPGIRDISYRH